MSLTDREKEQLKAMIDTGEPLPQKYRAVLFADPHEAELIWPGKTSDGHQRSAAVSIHRTNRRATGGNECTRRWPVRL